MKQTFTVLMLLSLLALAGCNTGTDNAKELELKEKELELKEKELKLKEKESKKDDSDKAEESEDDSDKAAEKKKTKLAKKKETAKKKDSTGSKGCALTNTVKFEKGKFGKNFKCKLDNNTGINQNQYFLYAKNGQELTVSFKGTGANYYIAGPNGIMKADNLSSNKTISLDADGRWIITVQINSGEAFGDYDINFNVK